MKWCVLVDYNLVIGLSWDTHVNTSKWDCVLLGLRLFFRLIIADARGVERDGENGVTSSQPFAQLD